MNIKWLIKFDGMYLHESSVFEWLNTHEKNNSSYPVLRADLERMLYQIAAQDNPSLAKGEGKS